MRLYWQETLARTNVALDEHVFLSLTCTLGPHLIGCEGVTMLFLSPEQWHLFFFHNSVVSQGERNSPLGQDECTA